MGKNICCSKGACCDGENSEERTKMMSIVKSDALDSLTQIGMDSLVFYGYTWKEFREQFPDILTLNQAWTV